MNRQKLTEIDHVAIPVKDISRAVDWYLSRFQCEIGYQDETWALLRFGNVNVAFVLPDQHPPHLGLISDDAATHGPLTTHRDGTRSIYIRDSEGNSLELLES